MDINKNIFLCLYVFLTFINLNMSTFVEIDDLILETKFKNEDYLNVYKVPLSLISFNSTNDLNYYYKVNFAFDDNPKTFWKSSRIQSNTFLNYIIISFSKTVTIDKMVYQAPTYKNIKGYGYPTHLRVYFKLKNPNEILNEDENENDFILIDDIISEQTGKLVLYQFNEELMCDQIKLEWVDVQPDNQPFAAASIIMLFYPENEDINKLIYDIFQPDDYAQLFIKPEYNDINIIDNLVEKVKLIVDIPENLQNRINRIKGVINGEIKFDKRREFTTNNNSSFNKIYQYGDIRKYSREILKMSNGGTNLQCTGIYGIPNDNITIFVDSVFEEPLPSLLFSQFLGEDNWISSSINLKKGKNLLTLPNFNTTNYKIKINPGGPLYIKNPYNLIEQSQKVKIYIGGGNFYPLFRINDDEKLYKEQLINYINNYNKDNVTYINVAEFYSNKIIISVSALNAYEAYIIKENSPQKNLIYWEETLKKYYMFEGIQFEENQPYYDYRNEYITMFIRYAQPLFGAAAYAKSECIGIYIDSDLYYILTSYLKIGATLPHEIGHMVDISLRDYPERTNNVLRDFSLEVIDNFRGGLKSYDFQFVETHLLLDDIHPLLRGCFKEDKSLCVGFFNQYGDYKQSYLLWWKIECFYHGYWGKLNNLYRYNNSLISNMTKSEAMVLLSSLVLGFDLGYYFERYGFSMKFENYIFNNSNPSNSYKEKMNEFINKGIIDNTTYKKCWYIDIDEYEYITRFGYNHGCYSNNDIFNIESISQDIMSHYYNISFPIVNCIGHLGFEIYENDILIGFSHKSYYYDRTDYPENYIPQYKIIAYDRLLNHSRLPEKSFSLKHHVFLKF